MLPDYHQAFQRLREKAALLVQRYRIAIEQRDNARGEIERLTGELASKDAEIRRLAVEIENLTVVRTAFPSRDSVERSRKYLSGLVREIDQCITDLTS